MNDDARCDQLADALGVPTDQFEHLVSDVSRRTQLLRRIANNDIAWNGGVMSLAVEIRRLCRDEVGPVRETR